MLISALRHADQPASREKIEFCGPIGIIFFENFAADSFFQTCNATGRNAAEPALLRCQPRFGLATKTDRFNHAADEFFNAALAISPVENFHAKSDPEFGVCRYHHGFFSRSSMLEGFPQPLYRRFTDIMHWSICAGLERLRQ